MAVEDAVFADAAVVGQAVWARCAPFKRLMCEENEFGHMRTPAELWLHSGRNGHERLWSTIGVRQGAPTGALMFALGLQEPFKKLGSKFLDV